MSDSSVTTLPDQIQASSANIPIRINESFDAASVATLFGRRASTCSGLTWGYYGGVVFIGGARTLVANGTIALTASSTNYVEVDQTGAVSVNTTGPTPSKLLLYTIVAGASSVTSYTDNRSKVALVAFFFQYAAVALRGVQQHDRRLQRDRQDAGRHRRHGGAGRARAGRGRRHERGAGGELGRWLHAAHGERIHARRRQGRLGPRH